MTYIIKSSHKYISFQESNFNKRNLIKSLTLMSHLYSLLSSIIFLLYFITFYYIYNQISNNFFLQLLVPIICLSNLSGCFKQ